MYASNELTDNAAEILLEHIREETGESIDSGESPDSYKIIGFKVKQQNRINSS